MKRKSIFMSKKFQLQIPKPCHENWNKMTPVEQGRFCGSCQKAVVDFTGMNDLQLVAFFKKPSTGSVCGRFYNDQLDRNLTIPGKRMPWLKYFLQLLVPAFLFSYKAKSQGEPRIMGKMAVVDSTYNLKDKNGNSIVTASQTKVDKIKGRVVDEQGAGIAGASIVIKGTKRGVVTDPQGNFIIEPFFDNSSATLIFSSVGFASKEMKLNSKDLESNYKIVLVQMEYMLAGEVVITGQCIKPRKNK